MSEPILPIPTTASVPDACASATTGEGALTALAAMIRKRRMGENHLEPDPTELSPPEQPPPV